MPKNRIFLMISGFCVAISSVAFGNPDVLSVSADQEKQLEEVGRAQGLPANLNYKRVSKVLETVVARGAKNLIGEESRDLINNTILKIEPPFQASKDYTPIIGTSMAPFSVLEGFDVSGNTKSQQFVVEARYAMFIKKDLQTVLRAYTPLEIQPLPGTWLEARRTKPDFEDKALSFRIIQYKALKNGHFKTLCTSSALVKEWTPDHTELQLIDNDCREVSQATIDSAQAGIEKNQQVGKENFIWTTEGREVYDLVRISPTLTLVVMRNITQINTHSAGWGLVNVGLSRIMSNAGPSGRNGLVEHLGKMGIKNANGKEF